MALSADQIDHYSRQILVPEIGGRGQQRLLAGKVRCLGRSATLATAVDYLAAAGLEISVDPADTAGDGVDLVLALAGESVPALGELPVLLSGEGGGVAWYSRRTTADTCGACLRNAVAEAAASEDQNGPVDAAAAVAGAALAADVMAQLLDLAGTDTPSAVVFSHGGRRRVCVRLTARGCDHRPAAHRPRP